MPLVTGPLDERDDEPLRSLMRAAQAGNADAYAELLQQVTVRVRQMVGLDDVDSARSTWKMSRRTS